MLKISVVIPLYNKCDHINKALSSIVSQSYVPMEIIVVDDGSTDSGADVVQSFGSSLVRLVSQSNGGVSAARNRGIKEAQGEYIAFLDADDWWEEGFLMEITSMIECFPDCGIYSTGFNVHRMDGVFPSENSFKTRGVVQNYFRTAFSNVICHSSSVVIPANVFDNLGGFPLGMKLGEDLYMWTNVACSYRVCYSPKKLSNFNLLGQNRSTHQYTIEETDHSLLEFYSEGKDDLNEYIARCEIGKALVHSVYGYTTQAKRTERDCSYTRRYRFGWWKLWILNRLPVTFRAPLMDLYHRVVWLVFRKGLFQ